MLRTLKAAEWPVIVFYSLSRRIEVKQHFLGYMINERTKINTKRIIESLLVNANK